MRILVLFLCTIVLAAGCATSGAPKPHAYAADTETEALRDALVQAAGQVDASLFSPLGLTDLLGPSASAMASHPEIPAVSDRLEAFRTQAIDALNQEIDAARTFVEDSAPTLVLDDPDTLMAGDQSMTALFWKQEGSRFSLAVHNHLESLLADTLATLDEAARNYRIWARGKEAAEEEAMPDIELPGVDDFAVLFCSRFIDALADEELDVRTTPRPLGTGSLYEFFQGAAK